MAPTDPDRPDSHRHPDRPDRPDRPDSHGGDDGPARPIAARTAPSPMIAVHDWLGAPRRSTLPLIDVAQAAPALPPPQELREVMASMVLDRPAAHAYTPVPGLPELREEIARSWTNAYGGEILPAQVAVTAGCNEAFAATMAALAGPGDEILLPVPWYFNHRMWLDMTGLRTVPVPVDDEMLPDPAAAERLVGPRTRAIVLVTPNNPTGAEYPADLVHAFWRIARDRGLRLVLDETYRDFDSRAARPHDLFARPDWPEGLVHLYSFSKSFRLAGHRVGAMIADRALIELAERFLDTVTISAPALGQHAALWGLRNLGGWLAGERDRILARRAMVETLMPALSARGWQLAGIGGFFAWLRHPFDIGATDVARALLDQRAVLALPGSVFAPEGDAAAARYLRFAFANLDEAQLAELFARLADFTPGH